MQWLSVFDGSIIARFVTSPTGIATFCLLIVGIAAWQWFGFQRRINQLIRELKTGTPPKKRTF